MTTISHVWPGITPFNVMDLPWYCWVDFALAADAYDKAMAEARAKRR